MHIYIYAHCDIAHKADDCPVVERKVAHSLVPEVTRLAGGDHRHPWPLMIVYISDRIFHPISPVGGFSVTS